MFHFNDKESDFESQERRWYSVLSHILCVYNDAFKNKLTFYTSRGKYLQHI